jgi:hypothetical protein
LAVTLKDIPDPVPVSAKDQFKAFDYAARSLNYTYRRMDNPSSPKGLIKRIAVGIMIERAFREYWTQAHPHVEVDSEIGRTHWRAEDEAEFHIAKNKVDLKGLHAFPAYRGQVRSFPEDLLNTRGLVPSDQLGSCDAYVQSALVAPRVESPNRMYIYAFLEKRGPSISARWRRPSVVQLQATQSLNRALKVTIHGESGDGANQDNKYPCDAAETVEIGSHSREVETEHKFSSVQYLSVLSSEPQELSPSDIGKIEVKAPSVRESHLARRDYWHPMLFQNPRVYFAAWGKPEDYVHELPEGSTEHEFYYKTKTRNNWQWISELRPIHRLQDL